MAKKLYIHIGSHKTGTSSIQKYLYDNSELLELNNLSYFTKEPKGSKSKFRSAKSWLPRKFGDNFSYSIKNVINDLSTELANFPNDVIISSESFFYIFDHSELEQFKSALDKYFDEIKIIAYLRRQDRQLLSIYNQGAKNLKSPVGLLFGDNPLAFPEKNDFFDRYFDYQKKINMWSESFGLENIIVRAFEKEKLYKEDVVDDFLSIFKISKKGHVSHRNQSYGLEQAKVGFLMNQLEIPLGPLRSAVNRNLITNNKFLPKRSEAEAFYSFYRESNKKLNQVFNITSDEHIFNEDFSNYPVEGNERWSEDSANLALSEILKSLNRTYGSIKPGKMFDAALKLEAVDIMLSFELMKMLNDVVPNNPDIKRKLTSYEYHIKSVVKR